MSEWNHQKFGEWLRYQRLVVHKTDHGRVISQDKVAELLGVTQSQVSRWEAGPANWPGTDAPTLDECLKLADLFDVDFLELAKLCGRWNDELERRILVSLASAPSDLSDAPVAQITDLEVYRQLRLVSGF